MPAKPLSLESLETRLAMTSGLSAALNGGLLAIAGTPADDSITFNYNATHVTLVELNQSFPLKGLARISVATEGGEDVVQFTYSGSKKTKWIGVEVTVQAQGGNDQLIDAVGNSYYFGGPEDVLTFNRKGAAKINSAKLTWFDTKIEDSDLRAAVKQDYADKVLSRTDMLDLFNLAALDDLVSDAEFNSLQALVGNKPLFRKLDDVATLASYVVNGTVANQFFQQDTLGNLSPNSPGSHLELLVDKWFLGKDHPDSSDLDTGIPYEYREASGTLFVNGISYTDIRQGDLGDCYLLAGFASIAVHSSKPLTNMFIVNGDGTYTIRFYDGATPYYITVDSQLPVNQQGRFVFASAGLQYNDPTNELWVPLAEKAYAQLAEFGWLDTGGGSVNSYAAINAGWPGDATAQATGKTVLDVLVLDNPSVLVKAFKGSRAVTLITRTEPVSVDIVENHVYAMIGYDAKTRQFVLFNPWGLDNGHVPGIVRLTWEEVLQNFYAWDYGPKV